MTAGVGTAPADVPDGLMCLVADGLKESGFAVQLSDCEEGRRLSVERWDVRSDLWVSNLGMVSWECLPPTSNEISPKLTADIATLLLTGKNGDYPCRVGEGDPRGMSFLGVTGNELRARGFDVGLEIYEDNQRFEVSADLLVKKAAVRRTASVQIDRDGAILWECDYPYEVAVIVDTPQYYTVLSDQRALADSIVTRISRAISLSSAVPDDYDGCAEQ